MFSFEYYIASREVQGRKQRKSLSGAIVNIVVFGIALCVAVMIIAISILIGFKKEIQKKVVGFGSHIQILKMDSNYSFETQPITNYHVDKKELMTVAGISHIQQFATKPGIIKSGYDFEGVVLKGIGTDYDWSFFQNNLVEGSILHLSDTGKTKDALISKYIANRLNLKLGDRFAMYFIQDPPRMRDLKVKGIYETNLQDFDKMFVLCDLKQVVKLNDWKPYEISGYEVLIDDFDHLDDITENIYISINYRETKADPLRVENIKEKYPQIFSWLNLQDMNIMVFLIIMLLVTGINMISGLLILILESTSMIGLLKAMGTSNGSIRKIFLLESFFLTMKGLVWGNLIGWSVCLFQKYTHIIKLDAANYYISYVPININIIHILLLNAGIIAVIIAFLLFPSLIITKLDPVKSIRYN